MHTYIHTNSTCIHTYMHTFPFCLSTYLAVYVSNTHIYTEIHTSTHMIDVSYQHASEKGPVEDRSSLYLFWEAGCHGLCPISWNGSSKLLFWSHGPGGACRGFCTNPTVRFLWDWGCVSQMGSHELSPSWGLQHAVSSNLI